ncbi:PTS fructose transporter subunit IIA [Erwinia pyri]|uniref:PTS fructose transporter subunit IIA n=1 Tax=Erwinia pyri TaxID=3062598 RepID=A0AA50HNK7_9GAMM|nr:PTS fructose transporter subunit IIA [Erwinia sp. DE2]WLS76958.1 PTS fructose transporter subunit IIA [Erwinia sp. DE2]
MLQFIVATHGPLCQALIESAEMIFGELTGIKAVSLTNEGGIEAFRTEITKKIDDALLNHDGVLVLCDLLSGTPWNVASAHALHPERVGNVAVVAGVNLPLLLLAQEYSEEADPHFVATQLVKQVTEMVIQAMPVIHQTSEDF